MPGQRDMSTMDDRLYAHGHGAAQLQRSCGIAGNLIVCARQPEPHLDFVCDCTDATHAFGGTLGGELPRVCIDES